MVAVVSMVLAQKGRDPKAGVIRSPRLTNTGFVLVTEGSMIPASSRYSDWLQDNSYWFQGLKVQKQSCKAVVQEFVVRCIRKQGSESMLQEV